MSYSKALEIARVAALHSLVHTMQNADTWAERRRAAIAVLEAPEPNEPESSSPAPAGEVAKRSEAGGDKTALRAQPATTPSATPDSQPESSDIAHPTSNIYSPDGLRPVRPDADEPNGHAHNLLDHLDVSQRPGG